MNMFNSSRVYRSFLRAGLGLGMGLAAGWACTTAQSVFTCLMNEQCVAEAGEGAVCEPNNLCTIPDPACVSGKRWYSRSASLADTCFEEGGSNSSDSIAGTGEDTAAPGESGGGDSPTSGGDEGPSMTSDPVDDTGGADSDEGGDDAPAGSTGDGDGGAGSTGNMPMTCDEKFGAVPAYELCEETMDSCSFNVTLNQTSCTDLCMMNGSMCLMAFGNSAGDCASMTEAAECTEAANDNICVCSK